MKQRLKQKVFARAADAAGTAEAIQLPLPLAAKLRKSIRATEQQWDFAHRWLKGQQHVTEAMFNMMCPGGEIPRALTLDMFAVAVCVFSVIIVFKVH